MELGTAKEPEVLAAPLSGDDAERLVAYVENPTPPDGHNEFVKQADETFESVPPRDL